MAINPDFRDLFAALNAVEAKYLLVGGYALAVYGVPRYTKDLDIWIEPAPDNAERVQSAMRDFGAPVGMMTLEDLVRPGIVFQIGVDPNRIDLVTAIDGLTFDEAWRSRLMTTYGDQPVSVISRRDLIANKRATGRPQDRVDAEQLEER